MPETVANSPQAAKPTPSLEEVAFFQGLYQEFLSEKHRYHQLVGALMEAQGRVQLAEGRLRLTRDHMINRFKRAPLLAPKGWEKEFLDVRFVGVRAAEACLAVLAEEGHASTNQLVDTLNHGGFRFRSNAPAREVHAALIRQADAKKEGEEWVYKSEREEMKAIGAISS